MQTDPTGEPVEREAFNEGPAAQPYAEPYAGAPVDPYAEPASDARRGAQPAQHQGGEPFGSSAGRYDAVPVADSAADPMAAPFAEPASDARRGAQPAQPQAEASHADEREGARSEGPAAFASNAAEVLKGKVASGAPPSFSDRLRSGAIYVGVSIVCLLINGWTCAIYLAVVSAICAYEFYDMMHKDGHATNDIVGIVAAALYPIVMLVRGLDGVGALTVMFMMLLIIGFVYFMRARVPDISVSFFGAGYTGMMLSSLVLLRQTLSEPWGGVLLLLLFASVWFNDVGAYLVGSKIGKHKLAPKTSPKKSWEGFIAGLLVSAAFWCLMTLVPGVTMSIPQAIIFGIICGAAGVVGDLSESRIKRNVGVKDSGTLMPGHGGLLDRCDSLFFSSVVAVFLLLAGGCVSYV